MYFKKKLNSILQLNTRTLFLWMIPVVLFLFSACFGKRNNDPASYHDSLISSQIQAVKLLEERIRTLPEQQQEMNPPDLRQLLESERAKIRQWGAFDQDSSLFIAVDSCLRTYESLQRRQLPELEKLLQKNRTEFSKADEARLEFLYREIELLSDKSFQQVQTAGMVFRGKHNLNTGQNVPLQP